MADLDVTRSAAISLSDAYDKKSIRSDLNLVNQATDVITSMPLFEMIVATRLAQRLSDQRRQRTSGSAAGKLETMSDKTYDERIACAKTMEKDSRFD